MPLAPASLRPDGSAAREITELWWLMVVLGCFALAVVVIALVVGLRRDAHPAADEGAARVASDRDRRLAPESSPARRWLVGGGVVLPVVLVGAVFAATLSSMRSIADNGGEIGLAVRVTGHQWWWEVEYPDHGVVTANEIHIPVDTAVELELRSADVIHSFWVPELAGKMDLLPERPNTLRIDAQRPGRFVGHCAEFCGIQHANMGIVVVAHEPDDFERWVQAQLAPAAAPSSDVAARGADLFMTSRCASCHSIVGTEASGDRGPDLTHVRSRSSIGAGAADMTAPVLASWIADPHAIKDGVLMPAAELDEHEIELLVAYLEELR